MATSDADSFIPSTKEYQVLQKYFGSLVRAISDPVIVAADLYSANLISESTKTKANEVTRSRETRNYDLLDELMSLVALDSANFMKILPILQRHPPLLSFLAEEMKTDYESSMMITTQSTEQQHTHRTIAVDESTFNDLSIMQGKLGSLVVKIKKIVKLARINVHNIKQLLVYAYPYEEEIQKAKYLSDVFIAVRKLCSPVNIEVLQLIVDHFKQISKPAQIAIQEYEFEEQNYRKRLLSATFAQELKDEAELLSRNPTPECTITLKLNWSRAKPSTVKEFEIVIKNVFLDYSQYIHLYKVDEGCIFVTLCAPKPLMGALVKTAKTRLSYLLDIGVILLQIGDEVILDRREKEEVYKPDLTITDAPGSSGLPLYVSGYTSDENSTEKEVIHTEVYQDQPLPVDNSSTFPYELSRYYGFVL